MATIAYPLRIPKEILDLAKLMAKEEYVDKATALRQLLYSGAEEYVLKMIERGRISIGRAAELLNVTIYDISELAEKHNIRLGATLGQFERGMETVKKLLGKKA